MIAFQLRDLELGAFWHDEAPRDRGRGAFPLAGVPGTESCGMVYFEIDPGDSLGLHTDSPDEVIIVLSGAALATIGGETQRLDAGSVAFIPAMTPHRFQSVGDEPLRAIGVFPDADVVSTFEYALHPWGIRTVEFKATAATA